MVRVHSWTSTVGSDTLIKQTHTLVSNKLTSFLSQLNTDFLCLQNTIGVSMHRTSRFLQLGLGLRLCLYLIIIFFISCEQMITIDIFATCCR